MTSPVLFPLPYDGSAQHDESWAKGRALMGRKVRVVTEKGETVVGRVERYETSCDSTRRHHGVGFMLRCGSERFPYSVPVNAALKSIEALREPNYIRV